jgi:uncharacterized protein YoxC
MPDKAQLVGVRVKMAGDEFGEVGFTQEDRKLLITLAVNYANLEKSVERRLTLLEGERAYKDDLLRIEHDLRQDLTKKADKTDVPHGTIAQLEKAVESLDLTVEDLSRKVTWAYAFGAGGAAACSALTYLLTSFFGRH